MGKKLRRMRRESLEEEREERKMSRPTRIKDLENERETRKMFRKGF